MSSRRVFSSFSFRHSAPYAFQFVTDFGSRHSADISTSFLLFRSSSSSSSSGLSFTTRACNLGLACLQLYGLGKTDSALCSLLNFLCCTTPNVDFASALLSVSLIGYSSSLILPSSCNILVRSCVCTPSCCSITRAGLSTASSAVLTPLRSQSRAS
jgi:hypothetical protein